MDTAGWVWMILFYIFTAMFFAISGYIIIYGFKDLMELLSITKQK
jgi:hypothetical protein